MGKFFNISLLVVVVLTATPLLLSSYKEAIPAEKFMEISVHVDDSFVGEEHLVFVERDIRKPFGAEWVVELIDANTNTLVNSCGGSGKSIYKPSEMIPESVELFTWWMYRQEICVLEAGDYYVQTQWQMTINGYPVKVLHNKSNVFTVHKRIE